jgi:hypothetical protein
MTAIFPGRFTAQVDEPCVLFLIGLRVNKPLAIRKWLPVFNAMGPMLAELDKHPEKGLLHSRVWLSPPVIMLVQYWRSFELLEQFARNADDPHLAAWRHFNQAVSKSGVVGIFHETYRVEPGTVECVYSDMPIFGLPKATAHVPAVGSRETARRRMGAGDNDLAVPSA